MIPPKVAKEISVLFGPAARVSLVSDHGLSTSIVYRIESLSNWYALKRWPILQDKRRLLEIHRFQQFLADGDKAHTPRLLKWSQGETCLEVDGVHWELSEWKSGHPIEELGAVNPTQLLDGMNAIARMHTRSQHYIKQVMPAPGLLQRVEGLRFAIEQPNEKRLQFLESISNHANYGSSRVLRNLADRAWSLAPRLLNPLRELARAPRVCFWVMKDVWREHLLYRGDQIVGIIDFGASRLDWPGLDLARALGTLLLDSDPRWETAVEHYEQKQPESEITVDALKLVHRASVVLASLQWLDWFADGQFDWTNRNARSWNRVVELHQQLQDVEDSDRNQGWST